MEEIALLYFQIIADITIEFDGGLMQQSEKFYANPFTDLTVTTVAFILNPSLDITVRISGIGAGEKPTGSQPLSLTLTALSQAMPNANTMPYFTSPTSATVTPLTAVAREMLAKASPEDIVKYLGLDDAARLEVGTGPGTVLASTGWITMRMDGRSSTTRRTRHSRTRNTRSISTDLATLYVSSRFSSL